MNIISALDPFLRFTRSKATPNLPSVLTPPFNPAAGSVLPAPLEQARTAMPPGVANSPNPATLPRPVVLPDRAPDMPVPAIKAPQFPPSGSPEMTETRRVGAPVPHKQQTLPLAQLSSLPEPPMLKAPTSADGQPLATRPTVTGQMEIPKTRSKFWDTLKGIGYGAMIGAQRNPNNPWAMLGGAAAGGIGTFKAPSNADLLQYEAIDKPREQALALEQYQRDKMANDIALGREKTQTEVEDRTTKRASAEIARQREERLVEIEREKLRLDQERFKLEKGKGQSIGAGGLYLPDQQKVIPGTQRPQADVPIREDVPAYRKPTGEVVPNEYYVPRTERTPANDTQLNQDIDEFEKLKNEADTLGQQIKAAEDAGEPEKVKDLSARFQGATNAMRAKAQQIQERHGEAIEVGGVDSWPYVKRTAVSPRPRGSTVAQPVRGRATGPTIKASDAAELFRRLLNKP